MSDATPRSEPPAAIAEFHDQDWLIIMEALASWGGNPNDPDLLTNPRKGRAWDLVSVIASERDFPDDRPLQQVDDSWGAQEDR